MADSSSVADKVLLVEGQDDKHVVRHLCIKNGLDAEICIRDKESIHRLLPAIGPEVKAPGLDTLGIMADANADLTARWSAISNRLREANIEAPDRPSPEGTIIPGTPRIGVWLMPDNQSSGELEDFVCKMVPEDDPVWPMSRRYIREIPEEMRKFGPTKTTRAELYAWLATRDVRNRMGTAIGSGDLRVDGTLCTTFWRWIQRLFG